MNSSKSNYVNYVIFFLIIIGVSIYYFVVGGSDNVMSIQEDSIGITGLEDRSCSVQYADIESMELREGLPEIEEKVDVAERSKMISGTCKNSEYGEFEAYLNLKIGNCIVIDAGDTILVFNVESDSTTEQLYESLLQYIP